MLARRGKCADRDSEISPTVKHPALRPQVDQAKEPAVTLSPRLLDLLSLLGYYAANAPGLLIRLARALAFTADYHMHVLGRHASDAARTALARAEHQKVCHLSCPSDPC